MSSPLNTQTSRVEYMVGLVLLAPPPRGSRCSSLVLESKATKAAGAKAPLNVAIAPLVVIGLPSSTTTCGRGSRISRHSDGEPIDSVTSICDVHAGSSASV